jgi:hypothetical protein
MAVTYVIAGVIENFITGVKKCKSPPRAPGLLYRRWAGEQTPRFKES